MDKQFNSDMLSLLLPVVRVFTWVRDWVPVFIPEAQYFRQCILYSIKQPAQVKVSHIFGCGI
jgi:hypothetical protein